MLSDSVVFTKRNIKHITRNLDQIFSAIVFPIILFIVLRYVFDGAIDTGNITYVNFIVAGILVEIIALGTNNTTTNLVVDLQRGVVNRFKSLPVFRSAFLIGFVAADLFRNLVSTLIIIGIAYIVGFHPIAGLLEWMLIILLATLFSVAISWISVIMGLFIKSVESSQIAFFVIFPLAFISSAYVPPNTMPEPIMIFAENQPFTQVINAIRALMMGTAINDSGWLAVGWCISIIIFAVPLATWIFRQKTVQK
ncbi:MAG TPA: ABC transporter permease [Candidatus Saccharimonadales bacterium]|nr:ABC transporter permease [Candidatus Saccharimonadales bacterium]